MLIHFMSAAGFALLAGFLFGWRKERAPVGQLIAACLLNALWSLGQIGLTTNGISAIVPMVVLDMMRAGGWLWFAASLLPPSSVWFEGRMFRLAAIGLPLAICIVVIAGSAMAGLNGADVQGIFIYGSLAIAVIGLVILEQAYRNTPEQSRWGMKLLIVGVGAVFAYDLFLFSHALLFGSISIEKWVMRELVNLLIIPLLIIGARRYQPMGLDVFVSRHVVFFTATLFGAGAYLIAMAAAGYYLRAIGGEWGPLLQAAFLVGAMILLAIVLLSSMIRSRLKVFLAKHFYANRYDYREQWLALTQTLADDVGGQTLARRAMRAIGAIAGSNSGALWMEDPRESDKEAFNYRPVDYWNINQRPEGIPTDAPLIIWLREQMWVLNTEDCHQRPEIYGQLALPEWLGNFGRHQLILPLLAEGRLCGLIVLCEPKLGSQLDYEDIDLLKTVGSQVTAALRQHQANELLAESRQFEAYNRLTAFLMHDLKNIIAQQSLVVRNAARHKHDPEFVDDAIDTIDNSVQRMERLLEQLRQGRLSATPERVNLARVAADAVSRHSGGRPVPELGDIDDHYVRADPEALASIVGHVIRNAQQACDTDVGCVTVSVVGNGDQAEIQIKDNGSGMDEGFVHDRLFRPFDTTKGSQGMGIGAYQVREFVEQAGGRVHVESEPGRGTVFRLCFPGLDLRPAAAATKEQPSEREETI
jgi:putative PEP-CTERM system histidine kinase